jgi:xanthine dehydrogenase YagR molybdenum-binding subunit
MGDAMTHTGKPVSRVDGSAKVTGRAKYAAEFTAPDLAYGVVVSSTIARGRITAIHTQDALALPGVLQVFTHENRPDPAWFSSRYQDEVAPPGSPFRPLYSAEIQYSAQPVALVLAEDFEIARYAASLVKIEYEEAPHSTEFESVLAHAFVPKRKRPGFVPPPKPRGDAEAAFNTAKTGIKADYKVAIEHHNPMEMHASTVVWEGDGRITVYDKIQGVQNSQNYVCNVFGLAKGDVRVLSPFVGGAFGSGLRPQYQLFLAVMATLALKRSVRVVLTRQQMFTFGYRPNVVQHLSLAADEEGRLQSLMHEAIENTSRFEEYVEVVVNWSGLLYKCDNTKLTYKLAELDLYTPIDMRAPGATLGVYGIESAIDELSYATGIDPLAIRLRNYADYDYDENKPYTSKALRQAYEEGALRFSWPKRNPVPRSMKEGKELIGWGVATGIWEAQQMKAAARATVLPDGRLEVASATADIGTGTYTIMTQIAAEQMGMPLEQVTSRLGDSSLPKSPVEGGSWTAATIGSAVHVACEALKLRLVRIARGMEDSPLGNYTRKHLTFADGRVFVTDDPSRGVSFADIVKANGGEAISIEKSASPGMLSQMRYARYTHSAIFAEVRVDEELNTVRVMRVVNAVAAGRILNPKTARSQILGGVVMGIGMALQEETMLDHAHGRFMNHNFAEYHVPVNADIRDIDVIFVDEPDDKINMLGVKGLGEIGIVGTAAAIANAIYHATGKRVRDLPITIDKLL